MQINTEEILKGFVTSLSLLPLQSKEVYYAFVNVYVIMKQTSFKSFLHLQDEEIMETEVEIPLKQICLKRVVKPGHL